jgi:hypothetical protein
MCGGRAVSVKLSFVKSEEKHSRRGESDPLRWLRFIGAVAAFLAALGIAIMVFWFVLRFPRF